MFRGPALRYASIASPITSPKSIDRRKDFDPNAAGWLAHPESRATAAQSSPARKSKAAAQPAVDSRWTPAWPRGVGTPFVPWDAACAMFASFKRSHSAERQGDVNGTNGSSESKLVDQTGGQSETFKKDRQDTASRSGPSRLSRRGMRWTGPQQDEIMVRASSVADALGDVRGALMQAAESASSAFGEMESLLLVARSQQQSGSNDDEPNAPPAANRPTTDSNEGGAHGRRGGGDLTDARFDRLADTLESIDQRLRTLEMDALRQSHASLSQGGSRPGSPNQCRASGVSVASNVSSADSCGAGWSRPSVAQRRPSAPAVVGRSEGRPTSALDLFLEDHQGAVEGGSGRVHGGSMDALVRHLDARQARYELAQMGSGTSKWRRALRGTSGQVVCNPFSVCTTALPRLPRVHPGGKHRVRWQMFNLGVLGLMVVMTPLLLAFPEWYELEATATTLLVCELAVGLFFCVDTALTAVTSFYKEGRTVLESEPAKVLLHYVTTWGVLDLTASVPLAPILILSGTDPAGWQVCAVRLLVLQRFAKLVHVLSELRHSRRLARVLRSIDPARVLLGQLMLMVVLVWHWLACIWFYISSVSETPGGAAIDLAAAAEGDDNAFVASMRPSYVIAFHWAVSVTTGLGAPIRALTPAQSLYESLVVCLGVTMQSFVFGTVASAVGQLDEGARARQRKLAAIKTYVRFKRVPNYVRERVIDYYEYISSRMNRAEEANMLADLPSRLRIELAIVINKPFLAKVEMFKKAEAGAIALLALLMTQATHTPEENILFEGEANASLFFVRLGELRVYVRGNVAAADLSTKIKEEAAKRQSSIMQSSVSALKDEARAQQAAAGLPAAEEGAPGTSVLAAAGEMPYVGTKLSEWSRIRVVSGAPPANGEAPAPSSEPAREAGGGRPAPPLTTELGGAEGDDGGRIEVIDPATDGSGGGPPSAAEPATADGAQASPSPSTDGHSRSAFGMRSGSPSKEHGAVGASVGSFGSLGSRARRRSKEAAGSEGGARHGGLSRSNTMSGLGGALRGGPISHSFLRSGSSFRSRGTGGVSFSRRRGRTSGDNGGGAYGGGGAGGANGMPEPPGRLVRDNTATLALRSVVRHVVAANREVASEEAAAKKRIQEIKDASLLDIGQLGHQVGRLSDGAAFGEQSFLTGKPSMATVRTYTFCEIMSITHGDLDEVLEAYPDMRAQLDNFQKEKAANYRKTNERALSRAPRKSSLLSSIQNRRPSFVSATNAPLAQLRASRQTNRRPSFVSAVSAPAKRRTARFARRAATPPSEMGEDSSEARKQMAQRPGRQVV